MRAKSLGTNRLALHFRIMHAQSATLSLNYVPIRMPAAKPSFEDVALKELPVLYRIARRMTNPTDAEDLVGQTLLSAAKAWGSFDGRFPRSWLIRILKNAHSQDIRRRSSRPEVQIEEDDSRFADEGPWKEVDWRLAGPHILAELDRIPEEYRLAVTLCDIEELSYDEAAEAMEVPVGTVRSRLSRGRGLLRTRLSRFVDEDMN